MDSTFRIQVCHFLLLICTLHFRSCSGNARIDSSHTSGGQCVVSSFQVQPAFELSRYSGTWYATTANRLEIPIVSAFFGNIKDIQMKFAMKPDGNADVNVAASVFGWFCQNPEGSAVVHDPRYPQKMEVGFNTWWSRLQGKKPYWIIGTDYTGYAVVYSCWSFMPDGSCKPSSTYAWSLNRSPTGHTQAQQQAVDHILRSVCIDPSVQQQVEQTGGCSVE